MPGRKQQQERERKRAAKSCSTLDSFVVPALKRMNPGPVAGASDERVNVDSDSVAGESSDCGNRGSHLVSGSSESLHSSTSVSNSSLVGSLSTSTHRFLRTTVNDIGSVLEGVKTHEEAETAIRLLPSGEKYALFRHHRTPSDTYEFPSTFTGGCNRSFQKRWLHEHPWMVYSEVAEGAFCKACALFCKNRAGKGLFVNAPFRTWQKKAEKCKDHEHAKYHQEALQLAEEFVHSIEQPATTVVCMVDRRRAQNIERNRSILKCVADAILYCGRQCIALRGDAEKLNTPGNPGNFLSLLKLLAKYNETLHEHLRAPTMKCVTHMSPQTQNELVEIIGKHIILRDVVEEIIQSKYYSVLADEVTSHNTEHLALCARFVDAGGDIREEFLSFQQLDRITGQCIAEGIVGFLKDVGLQVENIRGQGYDGASNMASERVGVQARIKELAPLATYMHCSGHCLNLVICHSCSLTEVHNVLDRMKKCCRYFLQSPKRNGLLEQVVSKRVQDHVTRRKALLDLCQTRWAERHDAYRHFYQAYTFIVEALEVIGYHMHLSDFGALYGDWDCGNRSEAQQILASITTFDFIVVFLVMYQYLSHMAGITVKLQGKAVDIIEAHSMIASTRDMYANERTEVDKNFQKIHDHAVRMAEKVGCSPSKPRTAQRQQHRSNAPAETVVEYYKRNCAIPFLDHILSSLDKQFSTLAITATSLLGLVPSVVCSKNVDIREALDVYSEDLPSPELMDMELARWKAHYQQLPGDKRPDSVAKAIKECDPDCYPNIRVLLQLACTLPVSSCQCERSASALRRLDNYMRASMGRQRLANLALIHIHYDKEISLEEVVDKYAQLHPRRIELDSLIKS